MSRFPREVDWRRRTLIKGVPLLGLGVMGCHGGHDGGAGVPPQAPSRPVPVTRTDGDLGRPLPPSSEPRIRVRAARVDGDRMELGSAGTRLWVTMPGGAYRGMHTGPVRFRRLESGWQVTSTERGRSVTRKIAGEGPLAIVAAESSSPGLPFKGRTLSGTVNLVGGEGSGGRRIDVVCHLSMEDYLPGVLAGELFESWRPSTHESLAVAARSFALCERFHWLSRRAYDVVADERSQVWDGADAPARPSAAVERTRGQVLLFRGRVVPGYYSASCGGRPAAGIDAISSNPVNGIEPLSVPASDGRGICPCRGFGPHGSWRSSFDAATVRQALSSRGKVKGEVAGWPVAFELSETFPSGRPRQFRIVTARGGGASFELRAVELQRALNGTAKGRPVRSADFEITVRPDGIQVDGAGFGHGVGLCQYGTEALARVGRSPREILSRYYPGAEVRRVW